MTSTLSVAHDVGFGIELRRGRFDVVLDGTTVGASDKDETFETELLPGGHTLQMRDGRYSSRQRSFDVTDGESVTFRCHGVRIWPMYLASAVRPDLAIALTKT